MAKTVGKLMRLPLLVLVGILVLAACTPSEAEPEIIADVRLRLESGFQIKLPAGAGPHPVVLVFHAASDRSWQPAYAKILNGFVKEGFAAVFVDMYRGRGINGADVRRGALLPRAAAGDLLVAVDWVREQPWADPDKVGLFGISFGAATIMDAMVLVAPGKTPTSLISKPANGLAGVQAAALLSPWCAEDVFGFTMLRAVREDFSPRVPVLALLPRADAISDQALCLEILERNKANGASIEVVEYESAGHTFAQPRDDYGNPFPDYDKKLADDAFRRIYAFLTERLG